MANEQFIDLNGDKFLVGWTRSINYITEEEANKIKDSDGYDILLKNKDAFFFCYKLQDAVILEEGTYPKQEQQLLEE